MTDTLTLLYNGKAICTDDDLLFLTQLAVDYDCFAVQTPHAEDLGTSVYAGDRLISRTDINHAVRMATIKGVHIACEM